MFDSMKKNAVGLVAALSLGTCTGCAGTQVLQSQEPTRELYAAAESVDQKAWATISVYYETIEVAAEECAKPETPMELCEALETAIDATAERVATASDAFSSVLAYKEIYGSIKDNPNLDARAANAKGLLDQALRDWVTLRPKVENAIKTGRVIVEPELLGAPQ